jgi:hypothetical protein
MHPLVAFLALPIGFAASILRDLGRPLTLLFPLRAEYPFGDLLQGGLKPLGRFGVLIRYEARLSVPTAEVTGVGAKELVTVGNVEASPWVVRAGETSPSESLGPRGHSAFPSAENGRRGWPAPFSYLRGQTPYVGLTRGPTGGDTR